MTTLTEATPSGNPWERAQPYGWHWRGGLAAVRLDGVEGGPWILDVVDPAAEPEPEASVRERRVRIDTGVASASILDEKELRVQLTAISSEDPETVIELAAGSWPASSVVGRQIAVQLLPVIDPKYWPSTRSADVTVFQPVLGVQDPQLAKSVTAELTSVGTAITASGELVSGLGPEDTGPAQIGNAPLSTIDTTAASEAVASLTITHVRAPSFPQVSLGLTLRDADG
jgi:hypothetical protein